MQIGIVHTHRRCRGAPVAPWVAGCCLACCWSQPLDFCAPCAVTQAIEARRGIAAALARQWFGVFMRPRAPADAWLLAGLAGWLEGQFVRTFQGANELQYRYLTMI